MKKLIFLILFSVPLFATIQSKVGSFTQGTTAITGVGFQPQLVLFFASELTGDGSAANVFIGIGGAISSSSRFFIADSGLDASASGVTNRSTSNVNAGAFAVILATGGTATVQCRADFVSMDADGFTISYSVNDATARIINYVALAGFTNVAIGSYTTPASTGNADIATVGFQPDCVLTVFSTTSDVTNNLVDLSFFTPSNSFALSIEGSYSGTTVANRYQRSLAFTSFSSVSSAIVVEASFVSMLSNGFRLNYTSASAVVGVFYVALKGGSIAVGTTTQPTSNGTVVVSGLGFQPALVLLAGASKATGVGTVAHARVGIGAASSTSARFTVSGGRTNAVATSVASNNLDRANVIKFITEAGGSPTVNAVADISAISSGGFTLNWTTTDATAREVGYLAIGDVVGASGSVKHKVTQ
jgi:hypothetical protein